MRFLLVNGAVRADGNTAALLRRARGALSEHDVDELVLCDFAGTVEDVVARVDAADALVFGSGVYWGSWGSPLQRFLEVMTGHELTSTFVGKPAGALLSMDSVGGFDVAARLLFSLSCLGCLVPPAAAVILSRTGNAAAANPATADEFKDVWQLDDVDTLCANLVVAGGVDRAAWQAWPISRTTSPTGRWPAGGGLDLGTERFLK